VEHSNPPDGLVTTPFLVEKVKVSFTTLTATAAGSVALDPEHVTDIFQHFYSEMSRLRR
jgi:hypothetical protein